jgi:hypothetical protein
MTFGNNKKKTMNYNYLAGVNVNGFGELAVIYAIALFIIHILLALAVNGDAKKLEISGSGLFLVGSFMWGLMVFVFGLPALVFYWAAHHSSLRSPVPPDKRGPE